MFDLIKCSLLEEFMGFSAIWMLNAVTIATHKVHLRKRDIYRFFFTAVKNIIFIM